MNIVTLSIASREEVSRRAAAAFRGEEQGAHISFDSVDLLWNTLTKKRWEILRTMTGQGRIVDPATRRAGRGGSPGFPGSGRAGGRLAVIRNVLGSMVVWLMA